jgi:hypothetical protein
VPALDLVVVLGVAVLAGELLARRLHTPSLVVLLASGVPDNERLPTPPRPVQALAWHRQFAILVVP